MTVGVEELLLWEESFLKATVTDLLTLRVISMSASISFLSIVFMHEETPTHLPTPQRME